jgi:hypothetical protein
VDDIRSAIVLRVVVERLEKGDVAGAIEAMHLDVDAFARLELAIVEAYNAGGAAAVENLPRVTDPEDNRVVFRFGVRIPRLRPGCVIIRRRWSPGSLTTSGRRSGPLSQKAGTGPEPATDCA